MDAQDILDELDSQKRQTYNLVKKLKILTAILIGKNQNKELAKILDTDKSFTSKQIKELEEQGLITRIKQGREVRYEVNEHAVLKFLTSKVIIRWKKEDKNERA